jgi:hypothetical protein
VRLRNLDAHDAQVEEHRDDLGLVVPLPVHLLDQRADFPLRELADHLPEEFLFLVQDRERCGHLERPPAASRARGFGRARWKNSISI